MEHNIENKKNLSLSDLINKNRVTRQVSELDAEVIVTLLQGLDFFVNKKFNIFTQEQIFRAQASGEVAPMLFELRQHWYKDTSIIDEFISDSQTKEQRVIDLLLSWKRFIHDEFIFIKMFPECAVIQNTQTQQYYSILGLNSDFDEIFPSNQVRLIQTTLLPFFDKIVWDGLIQTSQGMFNPSFAKELVESCKNARRKGLLITSI